jgi:acyl transferase domain-containing protein
VAISATTSPALEATCHYFLKKLKTDTYNIEDLSYTSIIKRDHYRYRLAFAAKSTPDLEQQLSSKIGNLEGELRVSMKQTNLIFLFCGVGDYYYLLYFHLVLFVL